MYRSPWCGNASIRDQTETEELVMENRKLSETYFHKYFSVPSHNKLDFIKNTETLCKKGQSIF